MPTRLLTLGLSLLVSGCCVSLSDIADARDAADRATYDSFTAALRAEGLDPIEPPVRRIPESEHQATEMAEHEVSFPIAAGTPSPTFAQNDQGQVFRILRRPRREPRDEYVLCGCAPPPTEDSTVTVEIYRIEDYAGDATVAYTDHGLHLEFEYLETACPSGHLGVR